MEHPHPEKIPPAQTLVSPAALAPQVESGEYFREARTMYSSLYLSPLADRFLYLLAALGAFLVLGSALIALSMLLPLKTPVPYMVEVRSLLDERPAIQPVGKPGEDVNAALIRHFLADYVQRRESYDLSTLELNVRAVRNQSAEAVYDAWQRSLDPAVPDSPIGRFQRHSTRSISIVSVDYSPGGTAEVTYDASVNGMLSAPPLRMRANIAFRFDPVRLDQETGKASPFSFQVTDYSTRRVQD